MRTFQYMLVLMLLVLSLPFSIIQAEVKGPLYGGTIVNILKGEPRSLNPNIRVDDNSAIVSHQLHDFLIIQSVSGKLVPHLAQSWEASPDGKTWTIHLVENATWHDGVKFTSSDVKWTYETLIKEKGYFYTRFVNTEEIRTPDDYTVEWVLKNPDFVFDYKLTGFFNPCVLPKHIGEKTDWVTMFANDAVGLGPWKFKEWVKGSHIILVANEDYYLGGPYLDRVIYKILPSVETALIEVNSIPEVCYWSSLYYPHIAGFKPEYSVTFGNSPIYRICHILFNTELEPVNDVRVRRAIAHAVNTTAVNEIAYGGQDIPLQTVYTPSSPFFNPEAKQPEYDPAKAEALLDEAGYPRGADGGRMHILFAESTGYGMAPVNQFVKDYLGRVGIMLDFQTMEWSAFFEKVYIKKEIPMGIAAGYHGPNFEEFGIYVKPGAYRAINYNNSIVNELFEKVPLEKDETKRKEIYDEIQMIIAQDLPRISLTENYGYTAVKTYYHGWWWETEVIDKTSYRDIRLVWWEGGEPVSPGLLPEEWYELVERVDKLGDELTMSTYVSYGLGIVAIVLAIVAIYYARKR